MREQDLRDFAETREDTSSSSSFTSCGRLPILAQDPIVFFHYLSVSLFLSISLFVFLHLYSADSLSIYLSISLFDKHSHTHAFSSYSACLSVCFLYSFFFPSVSVSIFLFLLHYAIACQCSSINFTPYHSNLSSLICSSLTLSQYLLHLSLSIVCGYKLLEPTTNKV